MNIECEMNNDRGMKWGSSVNGTVQNSPAFERSSACCVKIQSIGLKWESLEVTEVTHRERLGPRLSLAITS
jgi:hypothetical protein